MTPGRMLLIARRFLREGPRLSYGKYAFAPRIRKWRNPFATDAKSAVPLHVIGGKDHVWMAGWMLASFFTATKRNWQVVWHDDGTTSPDQQSWLRSVFDAKIIPRAQADQAMADALQSRPLCKAYRDAVPLALKFLDAPLLCEAERFLMFDPDVLFYRQPEEILSWAEKDDGSVWFNADFQEPSLISPEQTEKQLGFPLWPRVNSGLCLLRRDLADLDAFEQWIALPEIATGHFWRREQTLYALAASLRNLGGLLPARYEVSRAGTKQHDATARHYVGEVRALFFREGLATLSHLLKT